MLKPVVHQSSECSSQTHLLLATPFIHGIGNSSLPVTIRSVPASIRRKKQTWKAGSSRFTPASNIKAVLNQKSIKVKAVVTVNPTVGDIQDLLLPVELVSAELDPNGSEKATIRQCAKSRGGNKGKVTYEAAFEVPAGFGRVGAVLVENEHRKEMYFEDIVLDGFPTGPVHISCRSWVHSKNDNPQKRVFFTNKSYLPSKTPNGLTRLRREELESLRGNGQGERKTFERIYDYDVYNDLGDPDSIELKRPVLGGKDYPYPRRCRTGRSRCETDPMSEKRSNSVYVPRDEAFSQEKQLSFQGKTAYSTLYALVHSIDQRASIDSKLGFPFFKAIDSLFDDAITIPLQNDSSSSLIGAFISIIKSLLHFTPPQTIDRDRFFWFRDEEFGRQTLAGLNPCSIQLVTEWPLKSKLDPKIYGPEESAITTELIEREIRGVMTVEEAIKRKKLFILDYHDLLLPFVNKVREIEGTTLYGSRTLFFLTLEGTLRPLVIELTRPPIDGKPQWKEVFSPCWNATDVWLWRLAKAHVLAHDSGYHQLVSHWLRTHCAAEPYIIATQRQLSAMHPIYRLLHPHFRYTMKINAHAREALINADGIIESSFSTGKYSMELCAVAYDKQWQFDLQALPADLINRGLAVEDPSAPHGLKLTIEDYPFANDGLLLWDTIKQWVTDYVNHYYSSSSEIESDTELQAWWKEIRTVGHGDKQDEPWWPILKTPQDLIKIVTIITWTTSCHHAAVNFGQYTYAGYFPNRPTIARTNMPTEESNEEFWKNFLENPEKALLQCFPSQIQAAKVMAVLDILSYHSPDEEYLGRSLEAYWDGDPIIKAAFERFSGKVKEIEGIIDARNANKDLKNRCGAGVVPYELLKPFSKSGVTGKGVPYSISI